MAVEPVLARLRAPVTPDASSHPQDDVSAYVGVSIDAAVNLLDDRAFSGQMRSDRLRVALADQQRFLSGLLGFSSRAAFDLRMQVHPGRPVPLSVSILARTWARDGATAAATANETQRHLLASLPRHVTASAIAGRPAIDEILDPYPSGVLQTAVITKREVTAFPSRHDAGVSQYFSVRPFTLAEADWTPLYQVLAECAVPVTVSVGLFPFAPPPVYGQQLATMATLYARLAREDEKQGGLYYGTRKIPPDAFAVEAEKVFLDYLRRCSERAFILRVQVTAPHLPAGLVEAVGSAMSPPQTAAGSHMDLDRVASTYELRWLREDAAASIARYNLSTIDCYPAPGGSDVAYQLDVPGGPLPLLSTLGDASDAACVFHLPVAVDGIVPGFAVRRGQFGHSEAYSADVAGLAVGTVISGDHQVRIPLNALTKHALVAGATGSGKTTTVLELLRQLWVDHGIPFLVIEPVNSDADDYRRLLAQPGFEAMQVITVGDEGVSPLRFNPFQVPEGVLVAEHIANLLACFKAAFGLWEPLPSIYQEALDLTYSDARILGSEVARGMRRWPTAVEFERAMGRATSELGYAGEVKANIEAASIRRAQQLCRGTTASTFMTDQPLDVGALLATPTVIELRSLGSGDEQSLMMALLLNAMTEHYKANRTDVTGLRHVTVVEEAHRLLTRPQGGANAAQAQAKERAAEEFANTLAENRKYGEGIVIAEQIPTKLVADAVKNTNLKVMHRMPSEEDRRYLGESMGLDDAQQRFATRLGTGEALVYADEYAEAVHVEIRRTMAASMPPAAKLAKPPFDACELCRARCEYRGAALSVTGNGAVRAELTSARRAVSATGLAPAEARERWAALLDALRRQVERYSAFPTDERGVADAAFCLFLHSIGRDGMNYSTKWPTAVARRLGIETPDAVDA